MIKALIKLINKPLWVERARFHTPRTAFFRFWLHLLAAICALWSLNPETGHLLYAAAFSVRETMSERGRGENYVASGWLHLATAIGAITVAIIFLTFLKHPYPGACVGLALLAGEFILAERR